LQNKDGTLNKKTHSTYTIKAKGYVTHGRKIRYRDGELYNSRHRNPIQKSKALREERI